LNTGLQDDIRQLRRHLDALAAGSDDLTRYELRLPPMPPGLYWQARWLVGVLLRLLEFMRLKAPDPWPVRLRQGAANLKAKPLLIWAIGTDRDTLREACRGFLKLQTSLPTFAPVLITDVADFAFFSRLGWLVEYLPPIPGEGGPYEERKARLLARLYQGAPALPVAAGLMAETAAEEIARYARSSGH
jgi:hypothetical protein